ncbi:MAG: hypothetical protein KF857_03645 [Fimbriimonadaceae bacterium]|nr:hypothetical protein [Fimbriimonadaceae bacterium]
MDCYEIWVDLAPGVKDLEFVDALRAYLGAFQADGRLESFRIRRRKLGFGPEGLGEFCITIEFKDLAQLDTAFNQAATRSGVVEQLHAQVYSRVRNFKSALYRDFPDPVRA